MKETSVKNSPPKKPKPKGLLMSLSGIIFKVLLLLLLTSFMLSVFFIGLYFFKGEEVCLSLAYKMLEFNSKFILDGHSSFLKVFVHGFIYIETYLNNLFQPFENTGISFLNQLIHSILLAIEIESTRFLIFCMGLPLIVLIVLIGLIDGLVKRDVRKFQGARESTFLFHRPKPYLAFCFFVPLFIFFALPASFSPGLFLLIMAVLLGGITNFSASYFKKYL